MIILVKNQSPVYKKCVEECVHQDYFVCVKEVELIRIL